MSGWNGAGVFTFPYNWEQDATNGINIRADRMDSQFFIISTNGFANTLTRDGQGFATANLPMNGFKHTGAANGANAGDYATYNQAAILANPNTFAATVTFSVAPVFTDASGTRTALGLTSAATTAIGMSGATIPLLSTANTWALAQTFTTAPIFTDASGTRTALGLGTAATQNTGTSGANVPLANGANTWASTQTFSVAPVFTAQAGTRTALGLGNIATVTYTSSTGTPTGTPADGDLWFQHA
jgi:hypothetical protein